MISNPSNSAGVKSRQFRCAQAVTNCQAVKPSYANKESQKRQDWQTISTTAALQNERNLETRCDRKLCLISGASATARLIVTSTAARQWSMEAVLTQSLRRRLMPCASAL
eukprot:200513-Pleurochrysis_carterae.AAC.1